MNEKTLLLRIGDTSDVVPFKYFGDKIPIQKGDLVFYDTAYSTSENIYHDKGIVSEVCVVEPVCGDWSSFFASPGTTVTLTTAYRPIYIADEQSEDDF